jgi:hypothetical protein
MSRVNFARPSIRPARLGADQAVIQEGLVAWYKFDEYTGQILWDYSTYRNHGMLGSTLSVDANDPTWTAKGLSFITDDEVINSTQNGLATGSEPHTMQVVFSANDVTNSGVLCFWGTPAADSQQTLIYVSSGTFRHAFYGNDIAGTTTLNTGIFYHAAFVYDGGTQSNHSKEYLYLNDAVEEFTGVSGGGTPNVTKSSFMTLGIRNYDSTLYGPLNGILSYVLIYKRALSHPEIIHNYYVIKSELAKRGITI